MKYILVLIDGAADYPVPELGGKTPLEAARTPNLDSLAKRGEIGLVHTVPDGFKPGSDVANLGVLGYDVRECYTGRSPLEALSMGVDMKSDDLALRANLVTLSEAEEYDDKTMLDYSAGEISTEEAASLIRDLDAYFKARNISDSFKLHIGISYRHCLILEKSTPQEILTPPHDILDKKITDYLPSGGKSDLLLKLMKTSFEFLSAHPINKARKAQGKNPANSLWFWGEGTKPAIADFETKYQKKGVMISAVDLLKGIAIGGGMKVVEVAGATGTINTDFDGKAQAAIRALEDGADFCMIHLEATDECGHQGDAGGKTRAIELIDQKILSPVLNRFAHEDFALLVMPDHFTPVSKRTHTNEPVPYLLYSSKYPLGSHEAYNEKVADKSGVVIENPWELTEKFLKL